MKHITFIRHAKSSHGDFSIADQDRTLTERGLRDASLVGSTLHAMMLYPDRIYSSHAVRALTTASLIATEVQYAKQDIVVDEALYLFTTHTEVLLDIIRGYEDKDDHIYIVGHNETMETLAREISNGHILHFPTACVLHCEAHIESWKELSIDKLSRKSYFKPKFLQN